MRSSSESDSRKKSKTELIRLLLVCSLFVGILVWREASNNYEVAEWKSKYETLLATVQGNWTNGCNSEGWSMGKDLQNEADNEELAQYLQAVKSAKCSEEDKYTYVCSGEKNQNSAVGCGKQDEKQYKLCAWIKLERLVTEIHNKKLQKNKVKKIRQIFAEIIQNVESSQEQMVYMIRNKKLSEQQKKLMKFVLERNLEKITSDDVFEVIKGLRGSIDIGDDQINQQDLIKYFNILSSEINETLTKGKWNYKEDRIQQAIFKTFLDSKVIEKSKDLVKLLGFFPQQKQPVKFELCYRASENDFDVGKWREKCGGLNNTVTLVKTTHNKIIGGYTSLSFGTSNQNTNRYDQKNETFLFSITENDKFVLKPNKENNLHNLPNWTNGQTFGFVEDLCIFQNSRNNQYSYTRIGYRYANPKYTFETSSAWQKFSGSQNKHFSTHQWQFHKVRFFKQQI